MTILNNTGERLDIGDALSDHFIMTAMRLEAITERYLFKPVGISAASFKILAFIKNSPGCSPSQILNYLGGTKSNITQRLNFLEKNKYISSSRSTGDKRKVLISISPLGAEKFNEVIDKFLENSIYLEKFFTKKELDAHFSFMLKFNSVLDKCEKIIKDNRNKLAN